MLHLYECGLIGVYEMLMNNFDEHSGLCDPQAPKVHISKLILGILLICDQEEYLLFSTVREYFKGKCKVIMSTWKVSRNSSLSNSTKSKSTQPKYIKRVMNENSSPQDM